MRILAGLLGVALCWTSSASGADLASLVKDLKSKDPSTRRRAADELGKLGSAAKPASGALVQALKDPDPFVRSFAAESLGAIGPNVRGVVEGLALALRDREKRVETAAAKALASMGGRGVKPLAEFLKDTTRPAESRRAAAASLGKIGPDARGAVPTLIEVLQVRIRGKKKNPPPNADMDQSLKLEVVQTLGKIGPDAKQALPVLESLAGDKANRKDRTFRQAIQTAQRSINGRKAKN